ncbi:hypothetical protein ACIQH5_20130 [Paenarthrobacter sp. NPDC091711]|uniref:hypothetical protein n=1 Tax=Paenarthrobacter sp. NPDC091711 TaxID=3364385 RepID=UPI0038101E38
MDLHRDGESSFGPESLSAGAMLPFEGRTLMLGPDGLPAGVLEAERDGWISPNNPLLVRGFVKILPLAWRGDPRSGYNPAASSSEIAAFASRVQSAGMYWAGPWRVLDLDARSSDSIGSYAAALRSAGATHVDCWTYSEAVGLALVWAGSEEAGTMSLALHVVPASWVSEPRVKKAVPGVDVKWSWTDVIDLYATTHHGAAGTL